MKTSENGIRFIQGNEGFASKPYNDNGHPAWGYGHDQQPGEVVPESISQAEATALLQNDLATRYEPAVNAVIDPSCTQNQFDALVDFAYNLGTGDLRTMVAHGWSEIPAQIPRWCNENGLPNAGLLARRNAEVELFNS